MRRPGVRASPAELALLVGLAVWGLFPIALLLLHALHTHTRFTGADGLIGADGVLGSDQLQYLAWARDAGSHGLISDLFSLAPSAHVYLQPIFLLSGALWRLGLSLQLAYLLWKPVVVVVLFGATLAWARRMFPDQAPARAAVVALSLFLYAPLTELVNWTNLGSGAFRFQSYLLGYELLPANKLWGYVPSALGLAMMPVVLLAIERALQPGLDQGARGPLVLASLAALLASWFHPWQGVTLLLILGGLAAWERLHGWRTLAPPAIAAALPLVYYLILSRSDPAWEHASQSDWLPLTVLLAGLGPLVLVALAGVRRPGGAVAERALLLWAPACLVTYFSTGEFAPHALQGLSLPFAVLAVRGFRGFRLPPALGALAIAAVTLPGLAYDARKFVDVTHTRAPQYYLTGADVHALEWVRGSAPAGGVLAPTPFASVVPSQTGRAVWVGHGIWTPDYPDRARAADRLFRGRMRPAAARAFAAGTGATLLVSDCAHRRNLTRTLAPLLAGVHTFGCARVYVLRLAPDGRSRSR